MVTVPTPISPLTPIPQSPVFPIRHRSKSMGYLGDFPKGSIGCHRTVCEFQSPLLRIDHFTHLRHKDPLILVVHFVTVKKLESWKRLTSRFHLICH